jgi:hypothetical protein
MEEEAVRTFLDLTSRQIATAGVGGCVTILGMNEGSIDRSRVKIQLLPRKEKHARKLASKHWTKDIGHQPFPSL